MKAAALFLVLALSLAGPALAADKHGGHEVEVGKYHVELIVKDKELSLYVRDQKDKPIDPKTVKATANVLSGKDKANLQLAAAGQEMLTGQAPFSIRKDAKVIVTFTVADGKSEQARFSLGAKTDHKGHKH